MALPERVSFGSFWSEALGFYTEDSKRMIGGGGSVALMLRKQIKASHFAMAGFLYTKVGVVFWPGNAEHSYSQFRLQT
jgi:hypothetical protein